MREIKFRAWDKRSGKFILPNKIDRDIIPTAIPTTATKRGFKLKSKFVLQQYTGLKDNNGKEIYEGDIVSCKTNSFRDDEKMEVYYDQYDGAYGLRDPTGKIGGHLLFFHIGFPEVIGNIYENPELFKEDKDE
jgi:uncharacterized phage protein (TIGR01671 family)